MNDQLLIQPLCLFRMLIVSCTEWIVGRLDWDGWVDVDSDVIQWQPASSQDCRQEEQYRCTVS